MTGSNDFDELRLLSDDVLAEVVREAEARLQAQLQIATAADQRALTFAGFQIAAATAALAGGVALLNAPTPDFSLATLAVLFALAMLAGAGCAMLTAWPRKFAIPGNEPAHWAPSQWQWPKRGFSLAAARVEQAACLQGSIKKNQHQAAHAAGLMHRAIYICGGAVGAAGIALLILLIMRQLG